MIGWAASAAVLATFCMNTMMPLRVLAIISNVLFCAFGALAHIFPVLILHAILLPVNVVRLVQIRRVVHGMQAAENSELSVQSLFPFMSRRTLFGAGRADGVPDRTRISAPVCPPRVFPKFARSWVGSIAVRAITTLPESKRSRPSRATLVDGKHTR